MIMTVACPMVSAVCTDLHRLQRRCLPRRGWSDILGPCRERTPEPLEMLETFPSPSCCFPRAVAVVDRADFSRRTWKPSASDYMNPMPIQEQQAADFISILVADSTRIHTQLLADAMRSDTGLQVVATASTSQEVLDA